MIEEFSNGIDSKFDLTLKSVKNINIPYIEIDDEYEVVQMKSALIELIINADSYIKMLDSKTKK